MTGQRSLLVERGGGMQEHNQQVGIKSRQSMGVFRQPCMSYYLPVMLLPYVFRTHPVLNMTSSSSRSLGCENWHCIYNATTNSD
jgi:hypothetical protein